MRLKSVLAAAAAVTAFALAAPMPAKAFDDEHRSNYRVGSPQDPYSYVPRLPRYYPYYNSGYWVPAEEMRGRYRYRYTLPPYQASWGWNDRAFYEANKQDRRWRWHRRSAHVAAPTK